MTRFQPSHLGSSELGYAAPWSDLSKMNSVAARQLAAAVAGQTLTTLKAADTTGLMSKATAATGEAHAKAAFWTALAIRVLGGGKSSPLYAGAQADLQAGLSAAGFSGSGSLADPARVAAILQAAVARIRALGGSNPLIAQILSQLGYIAQTSSITDAGTKQKQDSPLLSFLSLVMGGKPVTQAYADVWWANYKWPVILGTGAVAVLVVGGIAAARGTKRRLVAAQALNIRAASMLL